MRRILFYIFFGSVLHSTSFAQFERSVLDSLEVALSQADHDGERLDILDELNRRSGQLDFDLRLNYARQILVIAKRNNSPNMLLEAYTTITDAHGALGFYDSSLHYADLAIDLTKKHQLNSAAILATKGTILSDLGRYDEAISCYLKSIKKLDSIGKTDTDLARNNLAGLYISRQEYDKAIELLEWVLALGERKNDIQIKAMSSHNLGAAYWELGLRSKSMAYYESSLKYCLESNDSIGIAHNYEALATAYFEDSLYQQGINTLKMSIAIFEKIKFPFEVKNGQVKLAEIYLILNKLDSAYQLVYPIYISSETFSSPFYIDAIDVLSRIHAKKGEYLQALTYRELHGELRDSTTQRLYDQQVLTLEKTLEKEKLENEKKALQAEQARLDLVNKQQLKAAIGGIGGIIIISLILFFSYRRKQKDNKVLADRNKEIGHQAQTLRSQKNELEQLSNFKEALTHMIAHDLKNSLHSMLNLSAKQTSPEGQVIHRSSLFAYNLVTNMLEVTKFEEAEVKLSLRLSPISSVVNEAILEVNSLSEARKVSILSELDYSIHLNIDREMMVRVIINLLHNAIKYSPVSGKIYLSLERQTDGVQLLIKDQGSGISSEDLPHIFDKYWHKATGVGPSASGLGLAYCKLVMEAHGGSIEVESSQGKGTCFMLNFTDFQYLTDQSKKEVSAPASDASQTSFQLNSHEQITLKEFYPELSKIDIYEISKWADALDRLSESGLNEEWIQTLRMAIQTSDESLVNRLLQTTLES